jgi:hypothetical protein
MVTCPRPEHDEREADVGELHVVALEEAGGAQRVVRHPRRGGDVDDEPAVRDRGEACLLRLEARFPDHR